MAKTASINIRVDQETKQKAELLYKSFGITISDAINIFLHQSINHGGLPFELRHPKNSLKNDEETANAKRNNRAKESIYRAREMGRVLHVSEAFKTYPTIEEDK